MSSRCLRAGRWAASVLASLIALTAAVPAQADLGERRIGERFYQQLEKQKKIVHDDRYLKLIEPIGKHLGEAASGLYDEPFRFYVIRDKSLNAFAVPGGYMFVNTGLIDAVGTKDELAGVMCHEMNHVIHHDGVNESRNARNWSLALTAASLLLHAPLARAAVDAGDYYARFSLAHFSRKAETAADLGGADLCAKAGYNPYGLVWMMEKFAAQAHHGGTLEMLSDHPRDDHRISDLVDHFAGNPALFAAFTDDITRGVPIAATRDGGTLTFAQQPCPRTENGTIYADDASSWIRDATFPWLDAAAPTKVPPAGLDRVGTDTLALGPAAPKATWFARRDDVMAGFAAAYDPATRTALTCEYTPTGISVAVIGNAAAPPFRVAKADLRESRTTAGFGLGAPADALGKVYGDTPPARAADGSLLYRYAVANGKGETASLWFRVIGNEIVAFGRDTTF
jgi:Zn-dependent protease with chaperone function